MTRDEIQGEYEVREAAVKALNEATGLKWIASGGGMGGNGLSFYADVVIGKDEEGDDITARLRVSDHSRNTMGAMADCIYILDLSDCEWKEEVEDDYGRSRNVRAFDLDAAVAQIVEGGLDCLRRAKE